MKRQNRSARLGLSMLFLLCAVAFAVAMTKTRADAQTLGECRDTMDTAMPATTTYTVCLPLVRKYGPPQMKLGVDFGPLITDADVLTYDLPVVKEMGAHWVRVFLG